MNPKKINQLDFNLNTYSLQKIRLKKKKKTERQATDSKKILTKRASNKGPRVQENSWNPTRKTPTQWLLERRYTNDPGLDGNSITGTPASYLDQVKAQGDTCPAHQKSGHLEAWPGGCKGAEGPHAPAGGWGKNFQKFWNPLLGICREVRLPPSTAAIEPTPSCWVARYPHLSASSFRHLMCLGS